ncbi:hypothetical protein FRB96_007241 [Tulasnella sp. 330]|nr:hypothetical protein FRB96_007241 [Tulasnella sp. 330]
MHSISDLTTFARKTKGQVPPQLVGASTTVVSKKMYLFGGRLVSLRRMVSDLYVFDLETFVWEKLPPDENVPGARYFHSTDVWDDKLLVVFGGMGYATTKAAGTATGSSSSEDLCVLNDVRFFDLKEKRWLPYPPSSAPTPLPSNLIPRARYAHLSSVTSDRLFIIGGQDMTNVWLDDIHVYDLRARAWIQRHEYPRHCGTYRSVAVAGRQRVRLPQEEKVPNSMGLLGPPGSRFKPDGGGNATAIPPPTNQIVTDSESLVHLSYSAEPTPDFPCDILLYSNYNFTDVRRELEVISPSEDGSGFAITDRSDAMTGHSLPPGLRFPTGAILGTHLIVAGTYLAHSYQSFSVWSLNLLTLVWSRIDAGTTLSTGSWSRGVLWPSENKFLIFGNRAGNLVEDYNRRLLTWDHVAYIDLEAFGIYQPPVRLLDPRVSEMGLAALEEGVCADFEVIAEDGRRVKCSRKCLEARWPWFREQRRLYLGRARRALETLPQSTGGSEVPLPVSKKERVTRTMERYTKGRHNTKDSVATVETAFHSSKSQARSSSRDSSSATGPRRRHHNGAVEDKAYESDGSSASSSSSTPTLDADPSFSDPRLTPRTLQLSEPYAVTLALLQYIYSLSLSTPLQHAPPVLSALLLLATNYGMSHLEGLVRHAMHGSLTRGPGSSVAVYEVATVCDCQSLQIRALKVVMSSSRRPAQQQQPPQPPVDKKDQDGPPAGGSGSGSGGGRGGSSNLRRGDTTADAGGGWTGGFEGQNQTRPRGTSNANGMLHQQLPSTSRTRALAQVPTPTPPPSSLIPNGGGSTGDTGFGTTKLTVDMYLGGGGPRKLSLPEGLSSGPPASTATAINAQKTDLPIGNGAGQIMLGSAGGIPAAAKNGGDPGPVRRARASTVSEMPSPGGGNILVTSSADMDSRMAADGGGGDRIKREDSELLGAPVVNGHQIVRSRSMRAFGPESETEGEGEETESDGYHAQTAGSFPAPPTTVPGSVGLIQGLQFPTHMSPPPSATRRLGSPPRGGLSRVSTGPLRGASSANSSARQRPNEDPSLSNPAGLTPQHRSSTYHSSSSISPAPPPSSAYLSSGNIGTSRSLKRQTAGSEMTGISSMGSLASSSNSAASFSELGPVTPPPVNASIVTPWTVIGPGIGSLEGGGRSLDPIEEMSTYGNGRQSVYSSGGGAGGLESTELTPTHPRPASQNRQRPSSTSTGDGYSSTVVSFTGGSAGGANKSSSPDSGTPNNNGSTPTVNVGNNGQFSPLTSSTSFGSSMNKYDKEVEKQRKKLEKVERRAYEKREKEEKERWEKEEKRRKKMLEKPDPQIMADRMKYMGVMGFGR